MILWKTNLRINGVIVFNHEDIDVVYFMGDVDVEHTVFRKKLKEKINEFEKEKNAG